MIGITIKDEGDFCTMHINEDDHAFVLELIEELGYRVIKREDKGFGYRSSTSYDVLVEASELFVGLIRDISYKDIELT